MIAFRSRTPPREKIEKQSGALGSHRDAHANPIVVARHKEVSSI